MELLNPTITITNADGGFWLLAFHHEFDAHQRLDFTVQIHKQPNAPLQELIRTAFARLQEMIPPDYR
jgi:hypothetical protein